MAFSHVRARSARDQIKPTLILNAVFRAILGWQGDLGFMIRVHGQEFNSFRRKTQSKALHELKLHRQETFLYICDTLHMWEWDVRVVDIEAGVEGEHLPRCVGGRGAAPPEFCGGPKGYRLMLKRQRVGAALSNPVLIEAGIQVLANACPDESSQTWDRLRTALDEGFQSIDERLKNLGPLQPDRFSLNEVNTRLTTWIENGRWRA